MTVAWMLYVLLVSSLIACCGVALDALARRSRMPARWVWVGALAAVGFFAAAAPRGSTRELHVGPLVMANGRAAPTMEPTRASGLLGKIAEGREAITSSLTTAIGRLHARAPASAERALVVTWIVASAGVVLMLVIVSGRLGRARKSWPRANVAGTPVRIAPAVGPAVIGVARPEIVLPQWLLSRSEGEQRLVVVHEREHVLARDHLLLLGAWAVAAMLPWLPAVWFMMSRLRLAIELDCDARVLARGVRARPYGALLIDIAGQCAGHRVGALALADKTSHLERRLLAMRNSTRPTVARTIVLAGIAALSTMMACEARLPTSAELDRMNVVEIESRAAKSGLFGSEDKIYFLNDVTISAARARAISTDSIVGIDMRKARPGAKDEVRITTGAVEVVGQLDGIASRPRMRAQMKDGREVELVPTIRGERILYKAGVEPLIIIDGVKSTEAQMALLKPSDIATVEVRKGAQAAVFTDPAAANGVIEIVTKRAAARP